MGSTKKPFINTHTHIFTIKNVPPYLAKTFVPWPFYILFHINIVKFIYKLLIWTELKYKRFKVFRTKLISYIRTNWIGRLMYYLFGWGLILNASVYLLSAFNLEKKTSFLDTFMQFVEGSFLKYIFIYNNHWTLLLLIVSSIYMLYPEAWALLYNAAKKIFSFLKFIPSNQSIAFVKRYLNIMKFANYDKQKRIFDKLIKMSEADARFVVLPMDMEFMKAGKPQQSYLAQLEEINGVFEKSMKNCDKMIPFLFVDPRRIRAKEGKTFFDWEISEKVVDRTKKKVVILKDCLVKTYLEKEQNNPAKGNFKGIKLYPALGYYPFDEDLLALYYYCVDNEIPVLTHCVKGSIFWRGRMYKKWNRHPVFERANSPLETRAHNNYELQVNFTHPLNYLVLLENRFLYRVIKRSKNARLKELFDFDATRKYVSNKLSKLSLNIAHYGGVEEWEKYLRLDRNETAFELIENPEQGMSLTTSQSSGFELLSKPADLYHKKADWFSIISSMMLQYDNVYSDISYILHSSKMMPLLNDVLINNEKLAKKILYGTDFFVVRNHKSEKQLYSDLLATIGEDNMDKIARENPSKWLKT